jgi:hypothetical protein
MIASLRAGASFHCHKGVSIEPGSEHGFAYPNDEAGKPAKPRAPIVIPSAVLRAGARRRGFAGVAAGSASITRREIKSTQTKLHAASAVSLLTAHAGSPAYQAVTQTRFRIHRFTQSGRVVLHCSERRVLRL